MQRRFVLRSALIIVVIALASSVTWFTIQTIERRNAEQNARRGREALEAQLPSQIGRPVRDVVALLTLEDAERFWCDEPPGKLRGVSYHRADGVSVTIYLAAGEPLFRRFSEKSEWDYDAFLACRVGGIRYELNGVEFDFGPNVVRT